MKKLLTSILTICILTAAVLLTGCTSIINTPQGKIVSVTTRTIGLRVVATTTTTATPEVDFGYAATTVVLAPTSTNGVIYSPNFANTFDFSKSATLALGLDETFSSGSDQTYTAGQTNSVITISPKN